MTTSLIENDDYPVFLARIISVGHQPSEVYRLLRSTLDVSPAEAKASLSNLPVVIARGPRMVIESTIKRFQQAGATVAVTCEETA